MISIPLKQLCMKCAEPCSGHCTRASPLAVSVTKTSWLAEVPWLPAGSGRHPSDPLSPLWQRQGSKACQSCHKGGKHKGAEANQRLIIGLQRAFRSSDKEAQGNVSQSICHPWRKLTECKSLVFFACRSLFPRRQSAKRQTLPKHDKITYYSSL